MDVRGVGGDGGGTAAKPSSPAIVSYQTNAAGGEPIKHFGTKLTLKRRYTNIRVVVK
jgi:hypothetical protein